MDTERTDEVAALLTEGERAAFHGPPATAIEVLQRAAAEALAAGRAPEARAATWLLGVSCHAAGQYGTGIELLTPLVDAGEEPGASAHTRLFASLAAAAVAAAYRALGRHAEARAADEHAGELADAQPEALFDASLGLASDAIGLSEAPAAQRHLADAEALAATRDDWWRQRVRAGWVRAELALLAGDPAAAASAASAAVTAAEQARAPRHVAKGLLFLGVAQLHEVGDAAAGTLRRAATLAEGVGSLPVSWPARALLATLLAGQDPSAAEECARAARAAVQSIAADLPPALRADWLARPEVASVLSG